jgi:hypothetical protein
MATAAPRMGCILAVDPATNCLFHLGRFRVPLPRRKIGTRLRIVSYPAKRLQYDYD